MAAGRERHGGIEERLGLGDHLVAARLVVALAAFARIVRDRVGAVERIVQRCPSAHSPRSARSARWSGARRAAGRRSCRSPRRHLRSRPCGSPAPAADSRSPSGTPYRRSCRTACPCWRGASRRSWPAACRGTPAARGSSARDRDDGGKPGPERVGRNPGLGGRLLGDEIEQDGGDLQSVGIDTIHDGLSRVKRRLEAVFRVKTAKNAPKGSFQGPFSPKAGSMRRPQGSERACG